MAEQFNLKKPSSILEKPVKLAQAELDILNMLVAAHRVKRGMKQAYVPLYASMGKLSAKLMEIESILQGIKPLENEVERRWLCVKNS